MNRRNLLTGLLVLPFAKLFGRTETKKAVDRLEALEVWSKSLPTLKKNPASPAASVAIQKFHDDPERIVQARRSAQLLWSSDMAAKVDLPCQFCNRTMEMRLRVPAWTVDPDLNTKTWMTNFSHVAEYVGHCACGWTRRDRNYANGYVTSEWDNSSGKHPASE